MFQNLLYVILENKLCLQQIADNLNKRVPKVKLITTLSKAGIIWYTINWNKKSIILEPFSTKDNYVYIKCFTML